MFTAHAARPARPCPKLLPKRGVSLVEASCCLAICAILLGTAAPGLGELRMRQQIQLNASQLAADINLARSSAMSHNKPIRLSWQSSAAGSCYMVHSGSEALCRCDASGIAICRTGATLLRSQHLPIASHIGLTAATSSVMFDAQKGTVTPTATFKLADTRGRAIHQVVNVMGRLRTCSPGGLVPGMKAC